MIAGENREFVGFVVRIVLALLIILLFAAPLLYNLTR